MSVLFLNSWRVSDVPYYVTTHPQEKFILNLHSLSVSELLETFRIRALIFVIMGNRHGKPCGKLSITNWKHERC